MMIRCVFVVFLADVGVSGVRMRHDLKAVLQAKAPGSMGGPAATMTNCPTDVKVMQTEEGFCKNADTGEDLFFYCCNSLLACRSDANRMLEYYSNFWTVYQNECGVADEDFGLSGDGQRLSLREGSSGLACSPACQTSRTLQDKLPLDLTVQDILDRCSTTVVEEVWKPQLDGANWPMVKVQELDAAWVDCGGEPATTTTTTTPDPLPTTTSTTVTFTPEEPAFEEVDFGFFSGDAVYQGHKSIGFWKWTSRVLREDVREEVTGNHQCANKGARDMTYFASSLCYWIPDVPVASHTDDVKGIGLEWSGSNIAADSRFCGTSSFKESGECMKCNVCHNNARDADGTVKYTSWSEKIPLSSSCKKESWIDDKCQSNFSINNAPLITNVSDCQELEASYQSALTLHEQALAMIEALPRLIDYELPRKIDTQTAEKTRLYALWYQHYTGDMDFMRVDLAQACEPMVTHDLSPGYPVWWLMWQSPGITPGQVLANMTFAVPDRPPRDAPNYVDRMEYWQFTYNCGKARDDLQVMWDESNVVIQTYHWVSGLLSESEAELIRRRQELAHWISIEPGLRLDKEQKFAVWDPMKDGCYMMYDRLEREKPIFMVKCIQTYYDLSCEKECIDIQKDDIGWGCGVMEGAAPLDDTNRGGIRAACRPPMASWLKGPTSWGAAEEDVWRQCRRVFVDGQQTARHSQRILRRGMLEKESRWWQWQDRYYILESGDDVRSAVLRYWYVDPATDRNAPERYDKAIALWDAKRVEKSGRYCLNLVHFYRTYKLCVKDKNTDTRDGWFNDIQNSIRFPS